MTAGAGRGRRLALDVGTVRIGVAGSDPDGLLATPVETVPRSGGEAATAPDAPDLRRILDLVDEYGAVEVVVGLPRTLAGREGPSARLARGFAERIAAARPELPVVLVDERMSTVEASRSLQAAGRSSRRQRAIVDQAAAVVILQTRLDGLRNRGALPDEESARSTYADRKPAGMDGSSTEEETR